MAPAACPARTNSENLAGLGVVFLIHRQRGDPVAIGGEKRHAAQARRLVARSAGDFGVQSKRRLPAGLCDW